MLVKGFKPSTQTYKGTLEVIPGYEQGSFSTYSRAGSWTLIYPNKN
jgi:hypothetical protein